MTLQGFIGSQTEAATDDALNQAAFAADEMDAGGRCTESEVQQARILCLIGRAVCIEIAGIKKAIEMQDR